MIGAPGWGEPAHPLALCLAGWVVLGLRRGTPRVRTALALGGGALAAHLGWALLHIDQVAQSPHWLVVPWSGFCVLFVPLGVVAVDRNPETLRPLPLALAVARIGCVAAGCCSGVPLGEALPGVPHPVAAYDVCALIGLHHAAARCPTRWVSPLVVAGVAGLRVAIDPLRLPAPLGPTSVDVSSAAIVVIGICVVATACRTGTNRALPTQHGCSRGSLEPTTSPPPAAQPHERACELAERADHNGQSK